MEPQNGPEELHHTKFNWNKAKSKTPKFNHQSSSYIQQQKPTQEKLFAYKLHEISWFEWISQKAGAAGEDGVYVCARVCVLVCMCACVLGDM